MREGEGPRLAEPGSGIERSGSIDPANDRAIRLHDQFVDHLGRPLATHEMRPDGGDRDLRQDECRAAHLGASSAAEGAAGKRPQAGLEALSLIGDAAPERRRPVALYEIVTAIEHEQPRVVQMTAGPGRRVERRAKAVARLDRGP